MIRVVDDFGCEALAGWENKQAAGLGWQTSPFPEEFRRPIDFRGQTFVHRAIERRLLEHLAMGRIGWQWNVNF